MSQPKTFLFFLWPAKLLRPAALDVLFTLLLTTTNTVNLEASFSLISDLNQTREPFHNLQIPEQNKIIQQGKTCQ
jgi:hypothetical protein